MAPFLYARRNFGTFYGRAHVVLLSVRQSVRLVRPTPLSFRVLLHNLAVSSPQTVSVRDVSVFLCMHVKRFKKSLLYFLIGKIHFRYKSIVDTDTKSSRGRRQWEFFEAMDHLLAGDSAVKPVVIISSSKGKFIYVDPFGIGRLTGFSLTIQSC